MLKQHANLNQFSAIVVELDFGWLLLFLASRPTKLIFLINVQRQTYFLASNKFADNLMSSSFYVYAYPAFYLHLVHKT